MKSRTRSFLLLAAAVLLGSTVARAQTIDSPYRFVEERQSLGVFGGYVLTDEGTLELGPKSGPVGGVRYTLRISGPFTLEGEVGLLPTSRDVIRFDSTLVDGAPPVDEALGEADLTLLILDAALRFNLTGPRTFYNLMPYVLVGGGGVFEVAGDDPPGDVLDPDMDFDFGTTFAGKVGVGIEWFATRRVSLRADVRDMLWKLEAPEAFGQPPFTTQELTIPTDEWVQNFFFLLGASYHF